MAKKIPASRTKFEDQTGLSAIKGGNKTSEYVAYLKSKCSPLWMPTWIKMEKSHASKPITTKTAYGKALAKSKEATALEEKCAVGGGGKGQRLKDLAAFKREMQEKFE